MFYLLILTFNFNGDQMAVQSCGRILIYRVMSVYKTCNKNSLNEHTPLTRREDGHWTDLFVVITAPCCHFITFLRHIEPAYLECICHKALQGSMSGYEARL